jgi:hypothetical protein
MTDPLLVSADEAAAMLSVSPSQSFCSCALCRAWLFAAAEALRGKQSRRRKLTVVRRRS